MMILNLNLSFFLLCSIISIPIPGNATDQNNCLQTNSESGLPDFHHRSGQAGAPDRRIHHHHQAIITSYRFNCCGNITEWGVDLNPRNNNDKIITFDFDFQVWRPSPTVNETGCYSLVNNFIVTSVSLPDQPVSEHVARVTPSHRDQLQFQRGDVLGFYVESHGEGNSAGGDRNNGVVLLNSGSHTSELVWYGSITARTSQTGSCPYPVGTTRVLKSSTHAAPVISISTTAYPCRQSLVRSVSSSIRSHPKRVPSSNPVYIPAATVTVVTTFSNVLTTSSWSSHSGLISGVVVTIIVVCISTLVIISAVIIVKKRSKSLTQRNFGIALSNQVYGAPETILVNTIYDCPNTCTSLDCKPVSKATCTESVLYHCVGPNASKPRSSHVYVGDPLRSDTHHYTTMAGRERMDTECCIYDNPDTKLDQRAVASESEIHKEKLFDNTGLYVPTAEERSDLPGDHYEMQYFSTGIYNKLKFFIEDQIYWAPATTTSDLYSQFASKKYREIPRAQIKTMKELGSGEFGNVCKAEWSISGTTKEVAVKTLKPGSSESDRVRFLQEAAIMGQFNHPYVVKLYGVVTVEDPMMICIELMANGDLRGHLRTITPNKHGFKELEMQLLKFSRQIASGMAYLSKKAFVHRDLAARNILLDESLMCKISDFGMARDLVDDTYYTVQSKGGKIPVKWTAPEALFYKKYSTDSDVWSYGMVLFEIWSVGKKPFSEISNKEVLKKINSGYCQPPPPGCPRAIYQLMVSCWNPIHFQRPPFAKISGSLNASSSILLHWTGDDRGVAGELGDQLSEAEFLYQDLQNTYNNITY